MYYIVYVSTATALFSVDMLTDLLEASRRRNAAAGISGMLLYKGGNFMQVLEGPEDAVHQLYERIERDPRHHGSIVLIKGTQAQRQFPEWLMGFCDLGATDVLSLPGYSEFITTPLTGREFLSQPTRCQKLLLAFKRDMR